MKKESRLKLYQVTKKVSDETGRAIMISEAPSEPAEKGKWANAMVRIQIAFYVDEEVTCPECNHTYSSVDDFLNRAVRGAYPPDRFVCGGCWTAHKAKHQGG